MAVDDKGRVYVSDAKENNIKVFDAAGGYLKTIGCVEDLDVVLLGVADVNPAFVVHGHVGELRKEAFATKASSVMVTSGTKRILPVLKTSSVTGFWLEASPLAVVNVAINANRNALKRVFKSSPIAARHNAEAFINTAAEGHCLIPDDKIFLHRQLQNTIATGEICRE